MGAEPSHPAWLSSFAGRQQERPLSSMVHTRANKYDEPEGEQSPNQQLDLVQQAENILENAVPQVEQVDNVANASQSTDNASLGVPAVPGMLEHAEFEELRTNIL